MKSFLNSLLLYTSFIILSCSTRRSSSDPNIESNEEFIEVLPEENLKEDETVKDEASEQTTNTTGECEPVQEKTSNPNTDQSQKEPEIEPLPITRPLPTEAELLSDKTDKSSQLLLELWLNQEKNSNVVPELKKRDLSFIDGKTAEKIFKNRKKDFFIYYGEAGQLLFKIGSVKSLSLWTQMFADTDPKLVSGCSYFSYFSKKEFKKAADTFAPLKSELEKHLSAQTDEHMIMCLEDILDNLS